MIITGVVQCGLTCFSVSLLGLSGRGGGGGGGGGSQLMFLFSQKMICTERNKYYGRQDRGKVRVSVISSNVNK